MDFERGLLEKGVFVVVNLEEGFYFFAQRIIAGAAVIQKCLAFERLQIEGSFNYILNALPEFRRHNWSATHLCGTHVALDKLTF